MNKSPARILFSVLKPLLVTRKKTDSINVKKTLMQVMTEKIIPFIIMIKSFMMINLKAKPNGETL